MSGEEEMARTKTRSIDIIKELEEPLAELQEAVNRLQEKIERMRSRACEEVSEENEE